MKARILDAPSWDKQGKRMALLMQSGDNSLLKVFVRSGEGVSPANEYTLPWHKVGAAYFSPQPVGEPRWVEEGTIALRAGGQHGQKGIAELVLFDLQHRKSLTLAKEVSFYEFDPAGDWVVYCGRRLQPVLLHRSSAQALRLNIDPWFTIRPFFFWNPAGNKIAFQATYTPPRETKPKYPIGAHILIAEVKDRQVSLRHLHFEELRRGYNTFGVGWWDNDTILFGVDERQVEPHTMVLNPPTQFVLYRVAADGAQNRPQKLWQPDSKMRPVGGPLFWLSGGGMAYPIGREGRDYVVYFPKERRLKQLRFPEATWIYSATPQGDLLTVVNRSADRVYVGSVESGRVVPLRL